MGCRGCGKERRPSMRAMGLKQVECPICKKSVVPRTIYEAWCECGAYLDLDDKGVKFAYEKKTMKCLFDRRKEAK